MVSGGATAMFGVHTRQPPQHPHARALPGICSGRFRCRDVHPRPLRCPPRFPVGRAAIRTLGAERRDLRWGCLPPTCSCCSCCCASRPRMARRGRDPGGARRAVHGDPARLDSPDDCHQADPAAAPQRMTRQPPICIGQRATHLRRPGTHEHPGPWPPRLACSTPFAAPRPAHARLGAADAHPARRGRARRRPRALSNPPPPTGPDRRASPTPAPPRGASLLGIR